MQLNPIGTDVYFKDGFFGYGQKGDFKLFTLAHFVPIIILIISIVILYFYKDKIRKSKYENTIRLIIATVNLLSEFAYYWRALYVGSAGSNMLMITKLPLEVCDWSCIISSIMMFNKNEKLFQYCCCVTLTLGIIPLFYPAVLSTTGPTYFRYYQFWTNHILPIFSTFYMFYVHSFKPRKIAIVYALIFLIPLGLLAAHLNKIIPNTYFMYLNVNGTIGKFFPPNQYVRILIFALIMSVLYLVIYKIFNKKNS